MNFYAHYILHRLAQHNSRHTYRAIGIYRRRSSAGGLKLSSLLILSKEPNYRMAEVAKTCPFDPIDNTTIDATTTTRSVITTSNHWRSERVQVIDHIAVARVRLSPPAGRARPVLYFGLFFTPNTLYVNFKTCVLTEKVKQLVGHEVNQNALALNWKIAADIAHVINGDRVLNRCRDIRVYADCSSSMHFMW